MGLLLMQYEYQKAKQKVNLYELRGIRLNDMQERYTKRIANIEKLFNKKQAAVESKYSNMQNMLNSRISMMAATGGTAQMSFANMAIGSIFSGLENTLVMQGLQGAFNADAANLGKTPNAADGQAQVTASATQQQQQLAAERASLASQLQSTLQVVLQGLKDAELAELEAAEDRQREPIAEKDAEVQADVAENDSLLELAKARKEAAESRLPETVKDSVAHYGLRS